MIAVAFVLGLAVGIFVGATVAAPWLTPYLWAVRALAPRPPGRHRSGAVWVAGRPSPAGVAVMLRRALPWLARGEAETVLGGRTPAGAGEGRGTAGGEAL